MMKHYNSNMVYIKEFETIKKIVNVGLDDYFVWYCTDNHILDNYQEGLTLEIITLYRDRGEWNLVTPSKFYKEKNPMYKYREIERSALNEPGYASSAEDYVKKNNLLNAKSIVDYKIFVERKDFERNRFKIIIRHYKNNPLKFSQQAKYEIFFTNIFHDETWHLYELFESHITMPKLMKKQSSDKISYSFYDIMKYEKYLKTFIEKGKSKINTKYKLKLYNKLMVDVDELYIDLKANFPILYEELKDKYPQEFISNNKFTWSINNDTFFYLFHELKKAKIISKTKNKSISFEELAQNLMKIVQITPERGENLEYEPKSFVERLKNPILTKNEKTIKDIKSTINQLIDSMNKIR